MLRIDDTDDTRSKPEFEAAILEDLPGSASRTTSSRASPTASDASRSRRRKTEGGGRLYPCYETAEELDRRRKRQMAARQAAGL